MLSILCVFSVFSLIISSPVYIERDLSHWQQEYQHQLELLAWTHEQQQMYASGGYGKPSTESPKDDDMDDMTTESPMEDDNEMTTEAGIYDQEGSSENMDDMSTSDAIMMNEAEELEMN